MSRRLVSLSLLALLALAPRTATAAETVTRTEHGYRVVSDGPGGAFTLEIVGDAKQQEIEGAPLFFSVDKMVLQIVTPEIRDFLQPGKRRKMDDKAVLAAHRDFEAAYLEEANRFRPQVESSWKTLDNGRDALLWSFKMPPEHTQNVVEQIYLTTIAGDRVLMLVTSLTKEVSREASIQLLLRTASTLKMSK